MTRSRWTAIVLVFSLFACVCGAGICQTWKNYVKEDGYGKLLVEGDYLWSAGAVLYRFDVNTRAARVYRRGDGLPENNLSCIAVDSRGTKWLGTASRGLWLFNGVAFEPFGAQQQLGKSSIGCLAVDGDDNVWTAALGAKGLSFWDGQLVRVYGEESGLEGTIRGVTDNGDAAWCCTMKGIFRLDGEQWIKEKERGYYEIFSDSEGNIWAAKYGETGNVVCFDGAEWSSYSVSTGFGSNAFGFSEAPDGSIWVGTWNGLARFDGESWTEYTPGDGMPETWAEVVDIMSTAVDANNVLWATSSMGIISFDGETWSHLPMVSSIPMDHLMCACWTPDGLLFESYHGGSGFFDGVSWSVYSAERPGSVSGSPSMFYDQARNCVWLTGRAGHLSLFDLASRSIFGLPGDDVPLNPTSAMALDMADNLWVGSSMGVYRLQGETWTRFSTDDGLTSNDVNGIAIAANGDVWAWAGGPYSEPGIDVNIFSEGSWRQETLASEGTIVGLASDDEHNIWGLIQTPGWPASYTVVRLGADGSLKQWPLDTGVTGTLQGMFVSPAGDVWITGFFGALRFAHDEWQPVTPTDGVSTGVIESVAYAPHNETWICTETALSRLDESPIPWLDFHLTGATGTTLDFVPGDTLSLHGELHNPMTPCDVSIYVAFQLPGDETLFFWPTFSSSPAPAFTGALPDKLFWGPEPLFQHTFNGSEPAGSYFVKGAILSNETGGIIGEVIETPFAFTP